MYLKALQRRRVSSLKLVVHGPCVPSAKLWRRSASSGLLTGYNMTGSFAKGASLTSITTGSVLEKNFFPKTCQTYMLETIEDAHLLE
ncbi:hypothetical protein GOP47_0009209 [Adiantum capillus-veneris]|uniref:Uncharacterized protein n=1 Tax=Adiantum capillus-veneris TaxID=13818 RepID=A0A9D4UW63_ADICA|nr:hypothetical protein GOP47_0009209 [Adiantum capillus-veneris]